MLNPITSESCCFKCSPRFYRKSGFTLIELSVVLAIIGVILYGSMTILVTGVQTSQVNSTVATMDAIEKALLSFRVAFGRLPCPANIILTASTTNYGVEAANTGSCTGGSPAANFIAASGAAEGGVPTRALRLPDSYMYDGWGHKFRYAVSPNYTVTSSANCSLGTNPSITINDASGSARSTAAVYALISHGANGHGAYTSNGAVVNAGSTNADEQTNCHCDSAGAHTGGAGILSPVTYVQKAPAVAAAGSPITAFDDIVAYKEAWQLMQPNLTSSNTIGCLYANYYRTITIDHTKVGTVGNTDQSSFPVLFSGTYAYLKTVANGGSVQNSSGYDIIFTSDAAGAHLLPFERESWSATTGVSTFWVQVPTVSHSSDTVIYLQYGNPNITTDQSNKTGTWDSNYKGVWHLAETSGTTNTDSTSNGLNATKASSTQPNPVTGQIAGGQQYNNPGTVNSTPTDYDTISDNAVLDFGANQDFTVSAWVKSSQSALANYYPDFVSKSDNNGTKQGYMFGLHYGTSNAIWFFQIWVAGTHYEVYGASNIADGNWHYVVGQRSGSTLYSNQDGAAANSSAASSASLSKAIALEFGSESGNAIGSNNYVGALDEIRVSSVARSNDWIITEYNNQNKPDKATYGASGFYTVGAQTSR